jgi:phage terminase large subunit-like protein
VSARCSAGSTTSGRLRFRSAWLETGKGQAKSPLMGGIGLYMMGWYGVPRAEVYSIGQDKATANVLFKDASSMCRANIPGTGEDEVDTLESRGEIIIRGELDNAWKIEHPATGSKFQALANTDVISGPRPVAVLADEIHEFKSGHSIETWKRAIAKMPGDALMLLGTNTPATSQIIGTEYSEFYQRVVKGELVDDEAFAFIARVDKEDRETVFDNELCWAKALPALGITFPIENIRGEVKTARALISTAMSVKRLYFGIPLGSIDFWIAEDAWSAVQGQVDEQKLQELKGCKCWLALDLSDKNDLTALTAVWIDAGGHLWAKTWYWTIRKTSSTIARGPITRRTQNGSSKSTWSRPTRRRSTRPSSPPRWRGSAAEHDVQFLAFDVAGLESFIAACEQNGFPVWKFEGPDKPAGRGLKLVAHAQGPHRRFEDKQLVMPSSIERFEDRILEKTITIDASPVTYFCAGNAFVNNDGLANRFFDKKRSRGRIDGLVTNAMGVGAATMPHKDRPKSFWEQRA